MLGGGTPAEPRRQELRGGGTEWLKQYEQLQRPEEGEGKPRVSRRQSSNHRSPGPAALRATARAHMSLPEIGGGGSPERAGEARGDGEEGKRMLERQNMQAAAEPSSPSSSPYMSFLPSPGDVKAEIQAGRERSNSQMMEQQMLGAAAVPPLGGLKSTEEYAEYAQALRNTRRAYDMGGA